VPLALYRANKLNILQLNESTAIGLGLPLERERVMMLIIAVALAASAVSVSGGIAFIGLMAPHNAKALVGPRARLFVRVGIFLGGWILLISDTIRSYRLNQEGIIADVIVPLISSLYFI